ncbi:MAG: Spy/CpxP family protein refolding chaperone [Sulfurovum sp.]
MKTLKVLTIVAITGLVGVTAANACPLGGENNAMCQKQEKCEKQNKCQKNKKYNRGEMKEIFKKLDLTAEQKSVMQSNRKEIRAQRQAKRAEMHAKRGMANMSEFVSANGFDKQAFIAKATQKSKTMIEIRADKFEKTMNILTPEQRVKFVTLLQEKQK